MIVILKNGHNDQEIKLTINPANVDISNPKALKERYKTLILAFNIWHWDMFTLNGEWLTSSEV